MRELRLNGRLVDLPPGETIAITKQLNDISNFSNRQVGYSNNFILPATQNNRLIIGNLDDLSSESNLPYKNIPCSYIDGGDEIFSVGTAIVDSVQNGFSVTLYLGSFDFFTKISDLTLKNIDWSALDHIYGVSQIATINNSASVGGPLAWPLAQYGTVSSKEVSKDVDIRYMMPWLRVSYMFDKIFALAGYTYSGSIFVDPAFVDWFFAPMPDALAGDSDAILLTRSFESSMISLGHNNVIDGAPFIRINNYFNGQLPPVDLFKFFSDTTTHAPDTFDSEAGCFQISKGLGTVNSAVYVSNSFTTIDLHIHMFIQSDGTGSDARNILVYINDIIVSKLDISGNNGLYDNTISLQLNPGDVVSIKHESQSYCNYYVDGSLFGDALDYSFISITARSGLAIGELIRYNTVMPEIKLTDIISMVCNRFALTFDIDSDGNNISFSLSNDTLTALSRRFNSNSTEDWSNKIDLSEQPSISFKIANYQQKNWLRFADSADAQGYGDSFIAVDDNTLGPTVDIFKMPVASARPYIKIMQPTMGSYIDGINIPRFTLIEADPYVSTDSYDSGSNVNYGGSIYECLVDSTSGITPGSDPMVWDLLSIQYEQTISSPPRTGMMRVTEGFNVIYTDGDTDSTQDALLLIYFDNPLYPYSLNFSNIIKSYYGREILCLNKPKYLTIKVRLTKREFNDLNFITPKYISKYGNFFLLNKLNEYSGDQHSALAELIRL